MSKNTACVTRSCSAPTGRCLSTDATVTAHVRRRAAHQDSSAWRATTTRRRLSTSSSRLNVERRHLDAGTRAFLALDYKSAYAEAAKEAQAEAARRTAERTAKLPNQGQNGTTLVADRPQAIQPRPVAPERPEDRKSRERAAKAVGASGRSVQRAQAVQRDRPDLADKVRKGEMALDAADRQRRQWARSQPKPEPVADGPVPLILRTHDGQEFPYPQPKGKATFNQTPGEGISWAEWSWNPVTGCLHGCDYCYAREIATSDRLQALLPGWLHATVPPRAPRRAAQHDHSGRAR